MDHAYPFLHEQQAFSLFSKSAADNIKRRKHFVEERFAQHLSAWIVVPNAAASCSPSTINTSTVVLLFFTQSGLLTIRLLTTDNWRILAVIYLYKFYRTSMTVPHHCENYLQQKGIGIFDHLNRNGLRGCFYHLPQTQRI
jgi:hypothetical protein